MSSSRRLGAAVTVAREVVRAARQADAHAVNHATKTARRGALVTDPVTGQKGIVIHASTQHVHTDTAAQSAR